jgi:hypothetical protein
MPGDRPRDVSGMTGPELERVRRDLQVSLALAFPGSPVRVPILSELSAIDRELAGRDTTRPGTQPPPHPPSAGPAGPARPEGKGLPR